jgi:digeranylgeranylglycerophospholipid reductase
MMLRLDHDIAPGGYSWIFHTGGDTAKVGVCYIQNDIHTDRAKEGYTIEDYLEHWLESDPRFADAEKIAGKQHRGSAHIQPPGSLSTDRFMAIGDTVPTIDPLWGEGIHKGMKSARVAAITADRCLTPDRPDTSAEAMSVYDDLWHDRVAPNARSRLLMTHLMYMADNARYDRFMEDMRRLGRETLAKANAGKKRAILKLLHLDDLPTLAKLARRGIGG